MKREETLFSVKSEYDTRKKLNRLPKRVDQKYLDMIEQGVTLEDLDVMKRDGLPIFMYQTQITIHGEFDHLGVNYIFGYKNLFQNKNKSIGIKYNAIDEEKRKRIADRLKCLGFTYRRDSKMAGYTRLWQITKETFDEKRQQAKALLDKIDTSLFYGDKQLYIASGWGVTYLCLEVTVNAIYEKHIELFLTTAGATQDKLQEYNNKKAAERAEREKEWQEKKRKEQEIEQAAFEERKEEINRLKQYPYIRRNGDLGTYVNYEYCIFDEKVVFSAWVVFMPERAKLPRKVSRSFDTLDEALQYTPTSSELSRADKTHFVSGYKVK